MLFETMSPMLDDLLWRMKRAPGERMSNDEMIAIYGKDGAEYRTEKLLSMGYIDIVAIDPYVCQVSHLGCDYLASEQERRDDEAAQQRTQERKEASEKQAADKRARKDAFRFWIGLLVSVVIAFVGAVIGAVLAVRTDLVDWIVKLFQ